MTLQVEYAAFLYICFIYGILFHQQSWHNHCLGYHEDITAWFLTWFLFYLFSSFACQLLFVSWCGLNAQSFCVHRAFHFTRYVWCLKHAWAESWGPAYLSFWPVFWRKNEWARWEQLCSNEISALHYSQAETVYHPKREYFFLDRQGILSRKYRSLSKNKSRRDEQDHDAQRRTQNNGTFWNILTSYTLLLTLLGCAFHEKALWHRISPVHLSAVCVCNCCNVRQKSACCHHHSSTDFTPHWLSLA